MTELTAREKITKYCQIVKEPGRRGDVLVYGKHRFRMSRLLANLPDDECEKVFKVMELQAHIDKCQEHAAKIAGRKNVVKVEAKPCECGCGRMARAGSRFLPGHDAKLKSVLRKAAAGEGDRAKTALAQLKARGWA